MKMNVWRYRLPIIALLVLFLVPLFITNVLIMRILVLSFMWALLALSLNIIYGYVGQLSLGQSAFFGIGVLVPTIMLMNFDLTPWLGILLGVAAAVASVSFFYPIFRLRAIYFALASLVYPLIISIIFQTLGYAEILLPYKEESLLYLTFSGQSAYYYIILVQLLVFVYIVIRIARSKLGLYFRAIKDDEDAAASIGIDTTRCKTIALAISAVAAALAGGFYSQYIRVIQPQDVFGVAVGQSVIVCIVGGAATPLGPVVGSLLLTPLGLGLNILMSMTGSNIQGLNLLVQGIAFMLFIAFIPEGLVPRVMHILASKGKESDK